MAVLCHPSGRSTKGRTKSTTTIAAMAPSRVPDDPGQPETDKRDQARVGTCEQHRAQHSGLAERCVRNAVRRGDREGGERQHLPRRERDPGYHGRLGGQNPSATRHGGGH